MLNINFNEISLIIDDEKYFSRHIELYLYNAKLNQTSRKPQNSPLVTVTSSFHGQ